MKKELAFLACDSFPVFLSLAALRSSSLASICDKTRMGTIWGPVVSSALLWFAMSSCVLLYFRYCVPGFTGSVLVGIEPACHASERVISPGVSHWSSRCGGFDDFPPLPLFPIVVRGRVSHFISQSLVNMPTPTVKAFVILRSSDVGRFFLKKR